MADTKDRTKQKACLERYRKACVEILGVLNKAAPQVRGFTFSFEEHVCPCCIRGWRFLENMDFVDCHHS